MYMLMGTYSTQSDSDSLQRYFIDLRRQLKYNSKAFCAFAREPGSYRCEIGSSAGAPDSRSRCRPSSGPCLPGEQGAAALH